MAGDVNTLLGEIRAGQAAAVPQLVELVYDELRRTAGGLLKRERTGHTLQPTALLNEAFVKLLGSDLTAAADRRVFFGAAVRAMRQVLVDHARRRAADKRIEGQKREPLHEAIAQYQREQHIDLLALHEALEQLATLNPRQAQVVEMRYFGGFTVPEVAELLEVSVSLVESDFRKASAFLRSRLAAGEGEGESR